jgi:hypothetical protein
MKAANLRLDSQATRMSIRFSKKKNHPFGTGGWQLVKVRP